MEATRLAGPGDLGCLVQLCRQAGDELAGLQRGALYQVPGWGCDLSSDGLRSALDDPARTVRVGTIDDHVVGCGVARRQVLAQGGAHGLVEVLYVEPAARNVGLGEAMMDAMMAWMVAEGCLGVDVAVLPGHRAAKSFMESAGFKARLIVMHHPGGVSSPPYEP